MTLSGAIRDSQVMMEQVHGVREAFRLGIESYFWFWFLFADAKLLRKALEKLEISLHGLRLVLDVVSKPMLDEIELLE